VLLFVPGQGAFGASDQNFGQVADQFFRTVTVNVDGTVFDPNPGVAGDTITTSYSETVAGTTPGIPPQYGVNVVDTAPRTISNLISDISANNPAAVQTAQEFGAQLGDGYTVLNTNPNGLALTLGVDGKAGTADDFWGADGAPGGGDDVDAQNLFIGNITPDAGLSAPFNNWMTFFGQFFDHGLDLITKGGQGTVLIPLLPDDPLITLGQDGIAGTGDEVTNPNLQFMALTRATDTTITGGADGIIGDNLATTDVNEGADDVRTFLNTTTPFVDQNQTYSSHPSHQVFLREYVVGVDGTLHTTGKLLQHAEGKDGIAGNADDNSGMATWADLKANALKLGIILTEYNVGNVPQLVTDAYGNFIPGPLHGGAQVVTAGGTVEMDPAAPSVLPLNTNFIGHAFINDMAHAASPFNDAGTALVADDGNAVGTTLVANPNFVPGFVGPASFLLENVAQVAVNPNFNAGNPVSALNAPFLKLSQVFDNELLNAHYVAGDGRVNENVALITVHEIFHDEHNRLIDQVKAMVQAELDNGDTAFATDWVLPGVNLSIINGVDGLGNPTHIIQANEWNGERLFQTAKFGTETQYQHLVFEEFARKVAPTIHLFGNNDIHLDPAITSEFANAVYRFGHSMLDENVPLYQVDPVTGLPVIGLDGQPVLTDMGLIQAFTNPLAFAALGTTGAAQIVQGTTHQIGSEIDEFVTGALRNNLLGLPLDLAALNIARGRDTGVAPLNLVRAQIYDATHDATLKPYANWLEFGQFLKHEASLVNFVAAYGTHATITGATTLADKRAAALTLVTLGRDPASQNLADDPLTPLVNEHDQALDAYNFMHSLGPYANDSNLGPDMLAHTGDEVFNSPLSVHALWSTGSVTGVDNIDLWIGGLAEKQNLFGGLLGSTFNFIFETQLESLQDGDRLYYLPRIEGMDFGFQIENNSFADMIIANTGARHIPASIFLTPEYTVEAGSVTFDPATWLKNPVTGAYLVEKLPDGTVHFIGDDNFFGNTMVLGGTSGDDRLQAGHADDDTVWGDAGNDWIDGGNGNDFLYGGTGNDTFVDSGGDDVIHGEDGNDWINGGIGDDIIFGGNGDDYIETGYSILGDEAQGGAGNDIIIGGDGDDALIGQEGDDWLEGGAGGDGLVGDTGAPTGQVPLYAGNDVLDGGLNGDKMVGFSGDDIMLGEGGFDKFNGLLGFDWADFEKTPDGVSIDMERREFIPNQQQLAGDAVRDFFVETEAASGTAKNDFMQGTEDAGKAAGVFNELTNVDLIFNLDGFFAGGHAYDWDATGAPIAGSASFSMGNILLGGDGSDIITGRGGNDIIDGDAWLHVNLTQRGVAGAQINREIRFDFTDGDTDTAVYRDIAANYTIEADANTGAIGDADGDGFITVSHNVLTAGVPSDGVDRLRNIERLQFADTVVNIDTSPTADLPPTGSPIINDDDGVAATPVNAVVGTALTIASPNTTVFDSDNITVGNPTGLIVNGVDPDGVGPATAPTFQWQELIFAAPGGGSQWVNINGATGLTYTPRVGDIGFQLRVVETFTDMKGVVERVFSEPTAPTVTNPATLNTAPFVVAQQNPAGLPDTVARTGFAVNIALPLTVTFGDNETPAANLIFSAKLAGTNQALDGSAAARFLTFTLIPDGAGGVTGATITAPAGAAIPLGDIGVTITATDAGGPGAAPPLSVTDTFNIHVQAGNLPPILSTVAESFNAVEATALPGTLLGPQVPDPDGPAPSPVWRLVAGSAVNGTVSLNGNTGQFVFTPTAGLSSDDLDASGNPAPATFSFQYRLFDGLSFSADNPATVGINEGVKTVTLNVAATDDFIAPVSITGTAAAGGTLSAVIGADGDGAGLVIAGSESFQWFRDGALLAGATNADLLLTPADVGHTFSVQAGYTDSQGFVYVPSAATQSVTTDPIGIVTVTGIVGGGVPPRILATNTLHDPDGGPLPDSATYTWEVSTDGITFLPADPARVSADTLTYTPPAPAAGNPPLTRFVRVSVVYIDGLGNLNSAAGEAVRYIIDSTGTNLALSGTTGDELIFGSGGNDRITALAGNDFVQGGAGADTFLASVGDGNDTYDGGNGTDTYDMSATAAAATVSLLAGTATSIDTGSDLLFSVENVTGSSVADNITGNNGANVLSGLAGNDILSGLGGADTLNGGANDDTLIGGANNDTLNGGADNDTYQFGLTDGNDTINEVSGTADRITILTGGAALNSLSVTDSNVATTTGNLVIAFNGQQITAVNHFNNTNQNIELINFDNGSFGGFNFGAGDYIISAADPANSGAPAARTVTVVSGNNLLAGESGANRMNGGTGTDLLFGAAGNDILNGGAGADLLVGGTGADTMNGDAGNDFIVVDIDGGNAGADVIAGGADTDTLSIIDTGAGGETLTAAFVGGRITQIEAAGSIAVDVERVTADLGAGTDTLAYTAGSAAVNVNLALGTASGFTSIFSIENVTGGNAADTFISGVGNNAINGGGGIDTLDLSGTSANATVNLQTGNASSAQIGNDTLTSIERVLGSSGDDTITANLAPETFTGNGGADTFVYRSKAAAGGENNVAATRSSITDFLHLTDHIDLTNIDAVANAAGNQDFIFDAVAKAGSGLVADQHLGYFHTTILGVDHTIIEGNITGDAGTVDFQIDLLGNITLTTNDFLGLV
jgi:Ca2+-binding RTX toxin-like protein